jgi:hypothetical protein
MWKKIDLSPKRGLFVLKTGVYQSPEDVLSEDIDKIIGYVLDTSGNFSGKNLIIPINSSENYMEWGIYQGAMYNNIKGLTRIKADNESSKPYNDVDGKRNTKFMVNYLNGLKKDIGSESPSLDYCINYSPGFHDKEWHFPSAGEMKLFYDRRNEFRKSCNLIGLETNMSQDDSGAYYFWTSTEYSGGSSWFLNFDLSKLISSIIK